MRRPVIILYIPSGLRHNFKIPVYILSVLPYSVCQLGVWKLSLELWRGKLRGGIYG